VLLQLRRKDAPGARQAWLALHEIDPDGVDTWALQARVLGLEGADEAARDLAQRVTERDPLNVLVGPLLRE
jgi:hypothetical protein